ncbi:MAG: DUF4224 domain-containing protein [Pseudomonadota bacterium]|nr:DUF4224 domain-containing protein [Pseudomonadota bacterium]
MFLTADEITILTGRRRKSCQIDALRKMGIPFRINMSGHPVVARSVIEGRSEQKSNITPGWKSNVSLI